MEELLFPKAGYFSDSCEGSQRELLETAFSRERWSKVIEALSQGVSDELLLELVPWRKGPFEFAEGLRVDSEWDCRLKWERLGLSSSHLADKYVVDIGCGNSFYMLEALGQGAEYCVGIDGSELCYFQSLVVKHSKKDLRFSYLLGRDELLLEALVKPDVVFCMGVLYHSRHPLLLLENLSKGIKPGGMLVLETIACDSKEDLCVCPTGNYAGMRNVYFIPSIPTLRFWLEKYQFGELEVGPLVETTLEEQRSTKYAPFKSLKDALDPKDQALTVEGYPRPARVVIKATKLKT